MSKKISKSKFVDDLIKKIKDLPVDERLQEHLKWIKKYRAGKSKHNRDVFRARMLRIADDIRLWAIQIAIEKNDIASLLDLTQEIYDRYEDKPKMGLDLTAQDSKLGGVVILPAIKLEDAKGNISS